MYASSELSEEALPFINGLQLGLMLWLFQRQVKIIQALLYILQEVGHRPGLGGLPPMR